MKRKKAKAPKQPESPVKAFSNLPADKKRRVLLQSVVGVGALGVGAVAISGYDNRKRELHDLSIVGEGKPAVVQIHDTTCPVCRSLKVSATSAFKEQDEVEYRIADLSSSKGKAFADKYRAQKTTLLFFDARGKHVHTATGKQTSDAINDLVAAHL